MLIREKNVPLHIAIIMDGNGRWAKQRGLPRFAGHKAGMETVRQIISGCPDLGVGHLTLYAFSTENWRRPKLEIDGLMGLFKTYMRREIKDLIKKGVRIRFLGDRSRFESSFQAMMAGAEESTANNTFLHVNVAMNYGARDEIIRATKMIAEEVRQGVLLPKDIDENSVANHLYTAGLPDPDLLIRTSGEVRLSNFLLWQLAYTEMIFVKKRWPEFTVEDFKGALHEYRIRERRFGALEVVSA